MLVRDAENLPETRPRVLAAHDNMVDVAGAATHLPTVLLHRAAQSVVSDTREVGLEEFGFLARLSKRPGNSSSGFASRLHRVSLTYALTFILRLRHVRQPVFVRRLISFLWRPPDSTL